MLTLVFRRSATLLLPILLILSGSTLVATQTTGEAATTGEVGTTGERDEGTTGEVFQSTAVPINIAIVPAPVNGTGSYTSITTSWYPQNNRVKRQSGYSVTEEISSDMVSWTQTYSGLAVYYNHTVTGLTPRTTYYFHVFLSNEFGNSEPSAVTAISTLAEPETSGGSTTAVSSSNTSATVTGGSNIVDPDAVQGASRSGGLSGGVIAGIVIAIIAVIAAIVAVLAKTVFMSPAPVAGHWLDSAVQNPLYQAGEQAFENPMYEAPAEAVV